MASNLCFRVAHNLSLTFLVTSSIMSLCIFSYSLSLSLRSITVILVFFSLNDYLIGMGIERSGTASLMLPEETLLSAKKVIGNRRRCRGT